MASRRLPVYLLLDCSESMAGTGIDEVNRGVNTLVTELRKNPMALETAYLSVITFSRYAKQDIPLTDIIQFQPPRLTVRPGTSMGAAVQLLLACMKREVVKSTETSKGDYKPLVFLFTDGQPTDDWAAAVSALRAVNNPKIANIYAIGCGPDVDSDTLRQVTDITMVMNDLSPEAWRKVFVWLSASVSSASVKLNSGDGQSPFAMPDLPSELTYVPAGSTSYRDPTPRQVFLTALCQKSRRPYLMRFARQGNNRTYTAIASHKLEKIEEGDGDFLPPINSSLLDGCPGCPYCANEIAATCPCGAVFCESPHNHGSATCPKCNSTLGFGGSGGGFDIQRSQG
jgi:uncharacterized protein YegL